MNKIIFSKVIGITATTVFAFIIKKFIIKNKELEDTNKHLTNEIDQLKMKSSCMKTSWEYLR